MIFKHANHSSTHQKHTFIWSGTMFTNSAIELHPSEKRKFFWEKKGRGHPGLNQGPLDLQSNALPLSYTPNDNERFRKMSICPRT